MDETTFLVTQERYTELEELLKRTVMTASNAKHLEAIMLDQIEELPLHEIFVIGAIYGMLLVNFRADARKQAVCWNAS